MSIRELFARIAGLFVEISNKIDAAWNAFLDVDILWTIKIIGIVSLSIALVLIAWISLVGTIIAVIDGIRGERHD